MAVAYTHTMKLLFIYKNNTKNAHYRSVNINKTETYIIYRRAAGICFWILAAQRIHKKHYILNLQFLMMAYYIWLRENAFNFG